MPRLAPSALAQITARYRRSGHAAPRAQRFGALFWRARDSPHVFGYDPKVDQSLQFIFEPTDAGFLLVGVMFWIIGWVLTQALVLKRSRR